MRRLVLGWAVGCVVSGLLALMFSSSIADSIYIAAAVMGPVLLWLSLVEGQLFSATFIAAAWVWFLLTWAGGELPEFGSSAEIAEELR